MEKLWNVLAAAEDRFYETASKRLRSQSLDNRPYRSLPDNEPGTERLIQMCEMGRWVNNSQDQLAECHSDQTEFKEVANNLAGHVGKAMDEMSQNQNAQGGTSAAQQNQVSELAETAKKIIQQRNDSSRDLGNQQSASSQKFTQVGQRQSDSERKF